MTALGRLVLLHRDFCALLGRFLEAGDLRRGLDAMTIMAFSLNLDPAYVGAHQMARYIGLALLMPAATAYVLRRMGVSAQENW